jgi:Reverse transcriptase (RNA-dependent DNA polymerase)
MANFYIKLGSKADDADEKIKQQLPLDQQFKADIALKVADYARKAGSHVRLDRAITIEEVNEAIAGCKRNSAEGPDRVPNALIKLFGPEVRLYLVRMFNAIFDSGRWPEQWGEGIIVPLFKGGLKTNLADYRPITLLSCLAKLFESIVHKRLSEWVEAVSAIADEQAGFRQGRSTLDNLFLLHELTGQRQERDQPTILAFLDVRKAYDRVFRDGLLHKMWDIGIQGKTWSICKAFLTDVRRTVLVNGRQSDPFDVLIGVPQGAILSPMLYSIFINGLVQELKDRGLGIQACDTQVPALLYADDLVLLARTTEEMKQMLQVVTDYGCKWQFRFNAKKSGILIHASGPKNKKERDAAKAPNCWKLGGESVPVVKQYKYLGLEFTKPGKRCWNIAVNNMIQKAVQKTNHLLYGFLDNHFVAFQQGLQVFKAHVWPTLEYGGAIWGPLIEPNKFEGIDHVPYAFGKKLLKLPGSTARAFIRYEMGLQSTKSRVMIAAYKFFGHLTRLPSDRLLYKVFRMRCTEVDSDTATTSWCRQMREKLLDIQNFDVWRKRAVPGDWNSRVKQLVQRNDRVQQEAEVRKHESLKLYKSMKPEPGLEPWHEQGMWHPGVKVKLMLRANAAPLAARVRERNHDANLDKGRCQFCGGCEHETVQHFVSRCPRFEQERKQCISKIQENLQDGMVATEIRAVLNRNNQDEVTRLMLSSRLTSLLVAPAAKKVESAKLNFLSKIWKKRDADWVPICGKTRKGGPNRWQPDIPD